jgi:hypothetical protein
MRTTLISGFLFMIMMILVLHNAIPHHHHAGFLMHNHEMQHDHQDSETDEDHHPEKCIIQEIDICVPRVQTSGKIMVTTVPTDYISTLVETDFSLSGGSIILFLELSCCDPPSKGILLEFPTRGPPSLLIA